MNRYAHLIIIVFAIIGAGLLWLCTPWGIGLTPDSSVYIGAARNLQKGLGFVLLAPVGEPISVTHYPPLYPMLLSLIGTMEPLESARRLNTFLFGVNILLVGLLVKQYTDFLWVPLVATFFMLTSFDMLRVHAMAWTEPLFIFLSILGLFFLARYLETHSQKFMVASSILIGLAFMSRYAGVAVVLTGILAIMFLSHSTFLRRIKEVTAFSVFSISPLFLWMLRNLYTTQSATNRRLSFHPVTQQAIEEAFYTFRGWIFPDPYVGFINRRIDSLPDSLTSLGTLVALLFHLPFLLGIIGLIISLFRKLWFEKESQAVRKIKFSLILLLFIVVYEVFLLFSISFFDEATALNYRILSPAYVASLILLFGLIGSYPLTYPLKGLSGQTRQNRGNIILNWPRNAKSICIILALIYLALTYIMSQAYWARNNFQDGQVYASRSWKESELIQAVNDMPSETIIYSNAPDAVYLLTNKPAYWLPKVEKFPSEQGEGDTNYLAFFNEKIQSQSAILVYFENELRGEWPSEEQLTAYLPLQLLIKSNDGVIYKAKSAP